MTSLIVDASVAVKWHVQQSGSREARVVGQGAELFAPDLVLAEIANTLWKYVRIGELSVEIAREMIAKAPEPFAALFPLHPLHSPAFELACNLKHPVYDCIYLALARREGLPLVTADKRLASIARNLAGIEVQLLIEAQ
jgi:predicted nucleic acid-binding protein